MPEIYMDHPDHGATCVFDYGSAEHLKLTGWKLREKAEVEAEPEAELEGEPEATIEAKPEKKKRGPKPKG